MASAAKTLIDPANIAGMRDGGISISGILDPLGTQIKGATGVNLPGHDEFAKFVNVPPDPIIPTKRKVVSAAAQRTAKAKKDKLARYMKLRTGGGGTILNSEDTMG